MHAARRPRLPFAAASVVFARCVDPGHRTTRSGTSEARRYLSVEPDATHWLFGYWDANYLAKRGLEVNAVHQPTLVKAGTAITSQCVAKPEYVELESISADVQPGTGISDGIMRWSAQASEKTLADAGFRRLVEQVNTCIRGAGLVVGNDLPLGGVETDARWSGKRLLSAFLIEASCRDRLNFTQQAADIDAAEQAPLVAAHLDELNRLRATATTRVASAIAILRQAGIAT